MNKFKSWAGMAASVFLSPLALAWSRVGALSEMRIVRRSLCIAAVLALALSAAVARAGDSKEQIRKVLRENPELVLEVLKEHKEELLKLVEAAARERHEKAIRAQIEREIKNPFKPVLDPDRLYLGKRDAPITVVAYSDFTCHYCALGYQTLGQLLARHPDQLRILLKHSPRGKFSDKLALAFMAIGRQDPQKAWRFAKMVMAAQPELAKRKGAALEDILAKLGLDRQRLAKDAKDPALAKRVSADAAEHRRFGFDGTPTYLLDGVSVRGAMPLKIFEDVLAMVMKKRR